MEGWSNIQQSGGISLVEGKDTTALGPYLVLDLTDEKGLLCGKLLGDLGADVIKVEKPGGDQARGIGPFYHDEVDPNKSLYWWAYNTSKRGITLDIETPSGKETFLKLVTKADFILESFPPGYMDSLGLGYPDLESINPGIIMVSITPFGQAGPHRNYKGPDIVEWAMGGRMCPCGDADRPPLRISHHSQSYLHGGINGAAGAMVAFHHRLKTGKGQHVDVSIQDWLAEATYMFAATWDMEKALKLRGGLGGWSKVRSRQVWPCKDGHVLFFYNFGNRAMKRNKPILDWLMEEGVADQYIKEFNFEALGYNDLTQEILDGLSHSTIDLFMRYTKAELLEGAVKRRLMLFPVNNVADVLNDAQLAYRNYWISLNHPEIGREITYPGVFTQATETPPVVSRRAPLVGEHNGEVLGDGLNIPLLHQYGTKDFKEVAPNQAETARPLEGVKVVTFSWYGVGPLTSKILSDCGAEVVRIEGRTRIDVQRVTPPFKDKIIGENRGGDFNSWHTGKLSVGINLAKPAGVEIAKRFVARADVVVENFAGGVMKRLGLDYEHLKESKPDLIMLSSCLQGQKGPRATHPGFGYQLTALTGFHCLTGWPDRDPTGPDGPYIDFIAPCVNVMTILAALEYRRRTGKGQYLDAAQYEIGLHFIAPLILDYVTNGRIAIRQGNTAPDAAPHNAYRCRGDERWCAIAVFTDEEWQSFCKVIGNPAWTKDAKFSTLQARKENEAELDRLVGEWTINHSAEAVMNMLQAASVAAGVVQNGEDLLDHDPQLKSRRAFWEVKHPEIGMYHPPRPGFLLSRAPYDIKSSPLLGEHTEYALKQMLGIPDEEIADLIAKGVLEC